MSLFTRNSLLALIITLAISATIIFAVNFLDNQRVQELRAIEDELSTDTLSIETQFALLAEAPCEGVTDGNFLSRELGGLGDKLTVALDRLGEDDAEVKRLKDRYTLLQIRDYILMKRISRTCGVDPVTVLYFYSNTRGECEDCDRASYALSYMRETYPTLRVYSFDYNLDLAALKTLIDVENVVGPFPAFVIEGTKSNGFEDLEKFKTLFPKALFKTASTTATSTKK